MMAARASQIGRARRLSPFVLPKLTFGRGGGWIGSVGAAIAAVIILLVVLGPVVWTQSAETQNLSQAFLAPSVGHPLGTDAYGRDLLSRILIAGRLSLLIGVGSTLIGLVTGVASGILAATSPTLVDAVIMRLTDALLALPQIVQAVLLVAALGRGPMPLVVALALSTSPIFTRVAYTAAKQVLQQDYIAAARCAGVGPLRTALAHILPNVASPVVAVATLRTGQNLLVAAALNYFGLGVQPPSAEWGLMVAEGQQYSFDHSALIIVPGVCILLASLGFNLLGDGVRDWLDPRLRRS